MHIIGDIALLMTLFCLLYEAIEKLQGKEIDFNKLNLINKGWPILLGMSICGGEGINLILPLRVFIKNIFNYI